MDKKPIESLKAMRIGVDMIYYALLTNGDPGDVNPTWSVPKPLPGVMALNINPNSSVSTAFFDDGPGEIATTLGNIEVTFNKSALSQFEKAALLGITVDKNGVLWSGSNDIPPWVAIGGRSLRSDGFYKYFWIYKGKFIEPHESNETKGESINFQSDEIVGRFVKLNREYELTDDISKEKSKVFPWKIEFDNEYKPGTQELIMKDPLDWFKNVVGADSPTIPPTV